MILDVDLTKKEKRLLRKTMIARIILFFLGILPACVFSCYMLNLALMSFVDGNEDLLSYIVPILFLLWYWGAAKYIFPQYANLFRYGQARTKQVIKTTVLDVRSAYTRGIQFFYVTTDSGVVINTKSNVIFYMDVPAIEIVPGMTLYIHIIPGMRNEILRVARRAEKQVE